jgi:hypothetical protein
MKLPCTLYTILASLIVCLMHHQVPSSNQIEILFQENFESARGWIFQRGNWEVRRNSLVQYSTEEWNTNSFARLAQSGLLFYEWTVLMRDGILDAGLHIFSSHGHLPERGSSYLIWQFKDGFVIYKTINNRLRERIRFTSTTVKDKSYRCRVRYDPSRGGITIWRDNVLIGRWIDQKPLRRGSYISFRTNKTHALFSSLRVYRLIR